MYTDNMKKLNLEFERQSLTMVEHEPGFFLGTIQILGTDHHFEMIEVVEGNDGWAQSPKMFASDEPEADEESLENNNEARYDAMQQCDGGIYQTVEFDGRTFVCHIMPFCD